MLTADLLTLKKYIPEDFEVYYTMVKDDRVMRYITGKGLTEEEARKKFDSIIRINEEENELGYFKVFDDEGKHIGDCKLERYDQDKSLLEVGYIVKKEFWGMGYGTLICERMLALADWVAPSADIVGIIDPENTASKGLLEKFNFKTYFIGIEDDLPTEKLRLSRGRLG